VEVELRFRSVCWCPSAKSDGGTVCSFGEEGKEKGNNKSRDEERELREKMGRKLEIQ